MEQHKRSYKSALTSKGKQILTNAHPPEKNSTPQAEKAGVESQTKTIPSAEKANEGIDSKAKSKIKNLDLFLKKLAKVEDNIQHLKETTIFLTFWKGTAEANRLRSKLQMEWQFLKGEFELVDRTNNWFEVKFANPLDRETVWDTRPFYAFGNLLVLLPWVPNFDPVKMEIRTVDVWVRILYLPTEYITPELVAAIIEHNEIGEFIRLDPFTEKRIRIKYARVCISIMKQEKPKNYVIIPTLEGEFKEYRLWYEGISEGCGSCGDENHLFELCPLRNPTNRSRYYRNEKLHVKEQLATNAQPEESFAEKGSTNMEWQQVSYRKGKSGYSIQLEKGKQRIIEEVAETEANQLINEQVQQQQDQITQQHQNADHQNLPAVQNQTNQPQGIQMENQQQPPIIQLEEDSFRTGNAGTSLTEQMKAVNVEDEYEATKKKKTRDTADTASTNSKRAKYSEYEDEDEE